MAFQVVDHRVELVEALSGEGVAEVSVDGGLTKNATFLQFLADAGYTGTVATNSEFELERYPRVGDEVSAETVFETISDEKKTAKSREVRRELGGDVQE